MARKKRTSITRARGMQIRTLVESGREGQRSAASSFFIAKKDNPGVEKNPEKKNEYRAERERTISTRRNCTDETPWA